MSAYTARTVPTQFVGANGIRFAYRALGQALGNSRRGNTVAEHVRSILGERLDVLVSNSGISKAATIQDHTLEDFDILFATNVRSPFFLVQQLLPILGDGSNIIVISSLGARRTWQARFRQCFDPCLRRDQGGDRDSRQELGGHSRASWHSRKRSRARRDRH
jgi:NAD(P)-dependent dehydrogenase (short-subunit alcohol dehydrogenase family)